MIIMNLSEEDRENLVAYLDGELDEETARALEARLQLDPTARAEAEAFKQAWGLLDYLPKPEPSPTFTHRTLERLALQGPTASGRAVLKLRSRWAVILTWAAALLVAVGLGFGAASLLWPPKQETAANPLEEGLVRYLRVIEKMHLYEHVEDVDFLRALDHPELFGEEGDS